MVTKLRQIVIIGPTASGKSDLAMEIAKKYSGEIVCADSRTVYKGMDIGTAKPSQEDQALIPHHLLDILEPNQPYSAGQFKRDAFGAINKINLLNKIPIIVGGSGLYIYGLIYDFKFPAGPDNKLRRELNKLSLGQLQNRLKKVDEQMYEKVDINNPRRLIRAIETAGRPKAKRPKLPSGTLLIGLFPGQNQLQDRINQRTDKMIENGLVEETKMHYSQYGNVEPLNTVGYREIIDYREGKTDLDKAVDLVKLRTYQLAKRQMTWFKRNKEIVWFDDAKKAFEYIDNRLKTELDT